MRRLLALTVVIAASCTPAASAATTQTLTMRQARAAIRKSWGPVTLQFGRCERMTRFRVLCKDRTWLVASGPGIPEQGSWLVGSDTAILSHGRVRVVTGPGHVKIRVRL